METVDKEFTVADCVIADMSDLSPNARWRVMLYVLGRLHAEYPLKVDNSFALLTVRTAE